MGNNNSSIKDKPVGCIAKKKYKMLVPFHNLGICAICCDHIDTTQIHEDRPKWLICCHVFHQGCIDRWFDKSPECPICCINQYNYQDYLADILIFSNDPKKNYNKTILDSRNEGEIEELF